jgi:hypothetical protein
MAFPFFIQDWSTLNASVLLSWYGETE